MGLNRSGTVSLEALPPNRQNAEFTYRFRQCWINVSVLNCEWHPRAEAPAPIKYVYRPEQLAGLRPLLKTKKRLRKDLSAVKPHL